jgi:hypothetical protein
MFTMLKIDCGLFTALEISSAEYFEGKRDISLINTYPSDSFTTTWRAANRDKIHAIIRANMTIGEASLVIVLHTVDKFLAI